MNNKEKSGLRAARFLGVLLACAVWTSIFSVCFASPDMGVVRVGVYPLDGYHLFDSEGNVSGYEVDYLERIAQETGWSYEYIELDSWQEGMDMLASGEIDLLSLTEQLENREGEFLLSSCVVGQNYCALMTTKDAGIEYEDFDAISGMTVGVEKGTSFDERYVEWAFLHGFEPNVIEYDNYNQLEEALFAGEVDAIAHNILREGSSLRVIAKFSYSGFYFALNAGNQLLKAQLDQAMTDIQIKDPGFQAELTEKYFPNLSADPITEEERKYIAAAEPIRIAVPVDRRPMIYLDPETGEVTGIAIDLLEKVSDLTGLRFEYVPYANGAETAQALVDGECALKIPAGSAGNAAYGLEDTIKTDPLMESALSVVSVGGINHSLQTTWSIGVTKDSVGMGNELLAVFGNCTIQEYEDWDAACRALLSGEVDSVAVNNLAASYLLLKPAYESIQLVSSISMYTPAELGAFREYETAVSIINKGIKMLDNGEVQNTITKYTSTQSYDYTFEDYVYVNRTAIITISSVLLVIFAGFLLYSARKRGYERKLLNANKRLQAATEAKNSFLSQVSHDLRTPMNAIIGMTELGMDGVKDDDGGEFYQKIRESGYYLLELINDILDISKIESKSIVLYPKPYDYAGFSRLLLTVFEPQCKKKSVQLVYNADGITVPYVSVDMLRFEQIMMNLLSNALKFTPEGGRIEVVLENSLLAENENMTVNRFSVRDSGIGMSEEYQRRMFEPFSQENLVYTKETMGTGLGLSIVKQLIDLMGGTIAVKSVLGEGTKFIITLPLPVAERPENSEPRSETQLRANLRRLQGRRVLLVEDNNVNTMIARKILERVGISVDCTQNGKEGLERFTDSEAGTYDAIIMDIRMPVMDGLEATRRIRALDRPDAGSIPIIAMTANVFDSNVQDSTYAGMSAFLAKPIDVSKLYDTLARLFA